MNIIYQLFDEQFVSELFKDRVLPLYPDFIDIKKIKIRAPKKNIWETTYHVVISYETTFKTRDGKERRIPIYCSAHSEEPRKNVYDALSFLWESGFSKGYLSIPHPLFFDKKFNAVFYRGVRGRNLYQFIREKKISEVEKIIPKAAAWFAKLHQIPAGVAKNYNPENSRIKTVIPGSSHIIERIKEDYPEYKELYQKAYKFFIDKEELFLSQTKNRWLVHGDAHPENVIKMSEKKIGVIDFTDLCLADFARDIGAFLQQLNYMIGRKIGDKSFLEETKQSFLENYLKFSKIKIDGPLQERIIIYYHWTALRTATYFLIKHNAEPGRARTLLKEVENYLKKQK